MARSHLVHKKQNNPKNTSSCLCAGSKRSERTPSKLLSEVNNSEADKGK